MQDAEEEDPFNKFWDAVEGLVQKISGPVAFTSAPLGKDDEIRNLLYRSQKDSNSNTKSGIFNSYMVVPPADSKDKQVNKKLINSYYSSKSIEEYEMENQQLKNTIDMMSRRIAELERTQQENTLLRSSIIQFKQDIQKQVILF